MTKSRKLTMLWLKSMDFRKILDQLDDMALWQTVHGVAFAVWLMLVPPTVIWWRDSVPWISFMSIWAIVITHGGSWATIRAAREETEKK